MKAFVTLLDKASPKSEQTYLYFRGTLAQEKFPEYGIKEVVLTPNFYKRAPYNFFVRVKLKGRVRRLQGYVSEHGGFIVRYDSRTFGD